MRHPIASLVLALLLCALAPALSAAATTTTYDLTVSDNSPTNTVQAAITVNSTENIVTVQVATKPRTITFVSTTDWYYRSSSGGTSFPVAANQPLTLKFSKTTTFYHVRQSADGTISALVVE